MSTSQQQQPPHSTTTRTTTTNTMKKGGGILRSHPPNNNSNVTTATTVTKAGGRGVVTFSSNFQVSSIPSNSDNRNREYDNDDDDDDDDDDEDTGFATRRNKNATNMSNNDTGYDSDDVQEAIYASGDALSLAVGKGVSSSRRGMEDDSDMMDDDDDNGAVVRSLSEIEEARRKRGRVRRREGKDVDEFYLEDGDDDDGMVDDHTKNDVYSSKYDNNTNNNTNNSINNNNQTLSLIEDAAANPDQYESNAGTNAFCPVEPFNMDAEKEGGMGYFDGDTYVFRQNQKVVDGEEDAWLDGTGEEEDGDGAVDGGSGVGVGGSTSTSIWKPTTTSTTTSTDTKTKKTKYITDDTIPQDIGRRIATLLQQSEETVMKALTRHGASLRELQSKEHKLMKKKKFGAGSKKIGGKKKGGGSKVVKSGLVGDGAGEEGDSSLELAAATATVEPTAVEAAAATTTTTATSTAASTAAPSSGIDQEIHQLKLKMEQTRQVVEELTELADALLFGGETDAYDLTRADWIHRFQLERYFSNNGGSSCSSNAKRPLEINGTTIGNDGIEEESGGTTQMKKQRHGYFQDENTTSTTNNATTTSSNNNEAETNNLPQHSGILWEYRGNEDGAIHGPYTSRQMMDWTSCGYFVGASAVDIRRVGSNADKAASSLGATAEERGTVNDLEKGEKEIKTDVDDLMADLMDDDDDDDGNSNGENAKDENTNKHVGSDAINNDEPTWVRSDEVDFSLYL